MAALPVLLGTDRAEQIEGSNNAEKIHGLGGAGEIVDGRGKDDVYAGRGVNNLIGYGGDTSMDRFHAGSGNDTVQSRDVPAGKDVVRCEVGTDTVYADKANVVSDDCERVKAW